MNLIDKELATISEALRAHRRALPDGDDSQLPRQYHELYAAQQALSWAREPNGFRAPFDTILNTPASSGDCQDLSRPVES